MSTKDIFRFHTKQDSIHSPLIIGGLGGSGTRVIAQIIQMLGIHLGHDFNKANDNLWFSYLFRYPALFNVSTLEILKRYVILKKATFRHANFSSEELTLIKSLLTRGQTFSQNWYNSRYNSLTQSTKSIPLNQKWGWKEPNSHLFVHKFLKIIPDLKYIHVIRNGLDMAFSTNQNQLKLWGKHLINDNDVTPANLLHFWAVANQRIKQLAQNKGHQILFINFEELCDRPDDVIRHIMEFLDMEVDDSLFLEARTLVKPPTSKGRHKQYDLNQFPKEDLNTLESFGYSFDKKS